MNLLFGDSIFSELLFFNFFLIILYYTIFDYHNLLDNRFQIPRNRLNDTIFVIKINIENRPQVINPPPSLDTRVKI